jgi:hypothetical protein
MTEQKETFKNFIEDLARIWLEYLIVYSADGVNMEESVTDPNTGEESVQIVNVPQSALEQLQATVKIDVTPKSVYDKFAQEQTIENLMIQGFFTAQRVSELATYAEILDDDSVAPKMKILEAIDHIKEEHRRIAMIEAQAQAMQQRANQFLMGDPDEQSSMIADAQMQMMLQQQAAQVPLEGEAEVMAAEEALPEPEVPVD